MALRLTLTEHTFTTIKTTSIKVFDGEEDMALHAAKAGDHAEMSYHGVPWMKPSKINLFIRRADGSMIVNSEDYHIHIRIQDDKTIFSDLDDFLLFPGPLTAEELAIDASKQKETLRLLDDNLRGWSLGPLEEQHETNDVLDPGDLGPDLGPVLLRGRFRNGGG